MEIHIIPAHSYSNQLSLSSEYPKRIEEIRRVTQKEGSQLYLIDPPECLEKKLRPRKRIPDKLTTEIIKPYSVIIMQQLSEIIEENTESETILSFFYTHNTKGHEIIQNSLEIAHHRIGLPLTIKQIYSQEERVPALIIPF